LVAQLSVLVRLAASEVDPQGKFAQAVRRVLAHLSPSTAQKPAPSRRRRVR